MTDQRKQPDMYVDENELDDPFKEIDKVDVEKNYENVRMLNVYQEYYLCESFENLDANINGKAVKITFALLKEDNTLVIPNGLKVIDDSILEKKIRYSFQIIDLFKKEQHLIPWNKVKALYTAIDLDFDGDNVIDEHRSNITQISVCGEQYDGAVDVAEYIVNEIKTNVKSNTVYEIQNLFSSRYLDPIKQYGAAALKWYMKVNSGAEWDHKPLIAEKFKHVTVTRLTPKGNIAISYYHKFGEHDYFYDVWSNIHYGYVGLVAGLSKEFLLSGADIAQFFDSNSSYVDPPDDVTAIKIGFTLYEKFGNSAQALTAYDVLAELEKNEFIESRLVNLCYQRGTK